MLSAVVAYEAAPREVHALVVGDVSKIDIQAPSDSRKHYETRQNAEEKAAELVQF